MVNSRAVITATVPMLKDVKILGHFSEAELGQLIQIGENQRFEPHSNIVIEGELSWGLYIILDGMVGIVKSNKLTGESYDVGQLRQSQYFGEMSLIDENPRSATVRALSEVSVFVLTKSSFEEFLNQSGDRTQRFYHFVIKDLISRLRELDEDYVLTQYQLWKSTMQSKREAG